MITTTSPDLRQRWHARQIAAVIIPAAGIGATLAATGTVPLVVAPLAACLPVLIGAVAVLSARDRGLYTADRAARAERVRLSIREPVRASQPETSDRPSQAASSPAVPRPALWNR